MCVDDVAGYLELPLWDVPIRINAAPSVPASARRVFVDEDSGGILPLDLLATDPAGDVVTFFITRMTGRVFQSIPFLRVLRYTGTL